MVKINVTRPTLRKRTGSKPHIVLIGVLSCIVVGFFVLSYMQSTTIVASPSAVVPAPESQTKAAADLPKTVAKTTTTTATKIRANTIAYAVSITGCGSDPLSEGAAVLKHAIHQSSIQGNPNARYDYQMYAIVHPDAVSCGMSLQELGYTVLTRDTPVAVKDIQGEYLRTRIEKNG
jgi:hypothetical protein